MPNFGGHISRHCVLEGACLHLIFGRLLLVVPFTLLPPSTQPSPAFTDCPMAKVKGGREVPLWGRALMKDSLLQSPWIPGT